MWSGPPLRLTTTEFTLISRHRTWVTPPASLILNSSPTVTVWRLIKANRRLAVPEMPLSFNSTGLAGATAGAGAGLADGSSLAGSWALGWAASLARAWTIRSAGDLSALVVLGASLFTSAMNGLGPPSM